MIPKLMHKMLFVFTISIYSAAYAKDQILVLSGGDDPGLNHYSQYLQTKTLYNHLVTHYGEPFVSLYFGAGNTPLTVNPMLDIHKIINTSTNKQNKTDVMLAGIIPNNNAATKENVLSYFMSPRIQGLLDTDNLFLFVSDHGMPYAFMEDKSSDPNSNNCIDLWNYQKPIINNFINADDFYNTCLSKNELATILSQLSAKHIIFQMSQCYSGGFHQLSVMSHHGYPTANPKICGFTASPPDHYASGCTADADGDTYQGYERSFTEWYTGIQILNGKKLREPAKTIFAAHQNAVLEDLTVDVPLSTSDYYLLQWASIFTDPKFPSRLDDYSPIKIESIYDTYLSHLPSIKDKNLIQFTQFAKRSEENIIKLFPYAARFARLSILAEIQEINFIELGISQLSSKLDMTWDGMMAVYLKVIMPAWESAVNANQVDILTPKEYSFEKEFYQAIIKKGLYKHPYQFEMYYLQYLSSLNNDADLTRYKKQRNEIIINWAKKNNNQTLINAVTLFQRLDKTQQDLQDEIATAERLKQLLKRILTYNKIIAAWVTLIKINDQEALNDLQGLLDCQQGN